MTYKIYYVINGEKLLGTFRNYEQAEEYLIKYLEYNPKAHGEIVDETYFYYLGEK